jgi:BRCA1-associated protein
MMAVSPVFLFYTVDVHRLIQDGADGKIVELSDPSRSIKHGDAEKKLEHIAMEYTHLLTSQLESQRMFYEAQLREFQDALSMQLDVLGSQVGRLERERDEANVHAGIVVARFGVGGLMCLGCL